MGALTGIRILDLAWGLAGSGSSTILACLGAGVVRAESRHRLDMSRLDFPTIFHATNRQKLGITLNLRHPKGVALAKELAKRSDAVVENFRAGVIDRLGLGYEELRKVKPDIIMLSASYHGREGPDAGEAGWAPLFTAASGLGDLTGYPDGPPTEIRYISDANVAAVGALAVIAALIRLRRSGEGTYIDLSCTETASCLIGEALLDYEMNGRVPNRQGNDVAHLAPHNCYRSRDGWVSIAVASEAEWQALSEVMGSPDWTVDPKFADPIARWKNRGELDQYLERWTEQWDAEELCDLLQQNGVAAVPSFDLAQLFRNRHVLAREIVHSLELPEGTFNLIKLVGKLSLTPYHADRPAPAIAEHNDDVFRGILGLTPAEIAELAEQDVLT